MEAVAESYFSNGDMKAAAAFYCNLMVLHPRYVKMARICRVLADPLSVPQPHRYADAIEALLEPSVTPGALFGGDANPADINKAYQRWTLLVHPDKNPYPRAADAFKRLLALKTMALEVLSNVDEPAGRRDSLQGGRGRGRARPGGRSDAPAAPNRHGGNASQSPRSTVIDATISEMMKRRVTLKSLKRKDVKDDELPELRYALRNMRERCFGSRPATPLSSTAPCIPTQLLPQNQSASPTFAQPPQRPHSSTERPMQNVKTASYPDPTPASTAPPPPPPPPPPQLQQQQPLSRKNNSLFEVINVDEQLQHQEGGSPAISPQYVVSEVIVEKELVGSSAREEHLISHEREKNVSNDIEASITRENDVKRNKKNEVRRQSTDSTVGDLQATTPSAPSSTSVTENGFVSFTEVVKGSIKDLIEGIRQIKCNRTTLRLNCDLTYAAYEREKIQQREAEMERNSEA